MTSLLHCIVFLQLTTTFALGQFVPETKSARVAGAPAAIVRSLYRVVVARHPIGLPTGADRKALAPYLSKGLISRIDTALACSGDYLRKHKDPNIKPPLDWLELGLFSGGNERALPAAFHVESTQPEKDGSFRVQVSLTYRDSYETYGRPPTDENTFRWHVDVIVARESGRFVIDDVFFPKDAWDDESRLSQTLTAGCDGPRWVGYGEQQNDSK